MADKSIHRSEYLKPLSREHHHALLLCWKIKTGISKGISPQRIKSYADWFYNSHLKNHFELEEKYIFPVLDANNPHVIQAIQEHRALEKLFTEDTNPEDTLKKIQTQLEQHIRFEERTLFNEIQNAATEEQIKLIPVIEEEVDFIDNPNDVFWE